MKICPTSKQPLKKIIFHNVEVDYCPECLGLWFEKDELRQTKDEKDKDLVWLDIDLWKNIKSFKISRGEKLCPECRLPFYEVNYGTSKIKVDVCNVCEGIWLDRGEFRQIMKYLKEKADWEILNNYAKNLFKEAAEVFSGPETLREEILDFLTVVKLLNYKLIVKHPVLTKIISSLPR